MPVFTEAYPDDAAVSELAWWQRFKNLHDEELEAALPEIKAWGQARNQAQPDNGIYYLLGVKPITKYDDKWVDGEFVFSDLSEPFTDEEVALLQKALQAERFETVGNRLRKDAFALRQETFGGFTRMTALPDPGYKLSWIRSIARHAPDARRFLFASTGAREAEPEFWTNLFETLGGDDFRV